MKTHKIKYAFLWEKFFLTNDWQHCLNQVTYVMQPSLWLKLLSTSWKSVKVTLFQAFKISSIENLLGRSRWIGSGQLFCAFTHCKQTVTFCHQMTGKIYVNIKKKKSLNTSMYLKWLIAKAYFVFTIWCFPNILRVFNVLLNHSIFFQVVLNIEIWPDCDWTS